MLPYTIIEEAGLDPAEFEQVAFAPPIAGEARDQLDKEGLLTGKYAGRPCIIRLRQVSPMPVAVAYISRSAPAVYELLSEEDAERLRGESMTPNGADAPVGQEAALRALERPAKPASLPEAEAWELPDTAESVQADAELSEVEIEQAPCGNPECFVMDGPEGKQEVHVDGCPAA